MLAGGQSSRFGSDKAEAKLSGQTLLERATINLAQYCEGIVIVGRQHSQYISLDDWPRDNMGPLGGLAAALIHARVASFDAILSLPVDGGILSNEMVAVFDQGPAHLANQPVIGLWPVSVLEPLQAFLLEDCKHSVTGFCDTIGSRAVKGFETDNINTLADLRAAQLKLDGGHD